MSTRLPDAGLVAWWTTAWLRGHVVADQVLDALRWMGVDGGWTALLADLRAAGATGVGIALPVEGDPLGLGGPPAFNALALESGSALVAGEAGLGLWQDEVDASTWWRRAEAAPRSVPDVGEADRGLRLALTTTANALADLDVARWRPEVADELMDLRRPALRPPPRGVPPACAQLAAGGARAARIVALAMDDDGGAVSASEVEVRRAALLPLERASRRALVAACSPEAWPPS
ncbi:hypothetical protein [Nocardioides bigeumensis]|uniref:DUF1403 family protein n=1 Tax=Nocardioides bigeumensis TaxID=433657 RepID=A0ABP5JJ75_9ACTN